MSPNAPLRTTGASASALPRLQRRTSRGRPRRAPPDALGIALVLPQVVGPLLPAIGDDRTLARQISVGKPLFERLEFRAAAPRGVRAGVLRFDPRERVRVVERFERQKGIGRKRPGEKSGRSGHRQLSNENSVDYALREPESL